MMSADSKKKQWIWMSSKYDHVYWPGLINADFNVKENKLPLDIQSHSD